MTDIAFKVGDHVRRTTKDSGTQDGVVTAVGEKFLTVESYGTKHRWSMAGVIIDPVWVEQQARDAAWRKDITEKAQQKVKEKVEALIAMLTAERIPFADRRLKAVGSVQRYIDAGAFHKAFGTFSPVEQLFNADYVLGAIDEVVNGLTSFCKFGKADYDALWYHLKDKVTTRVSAVRHMRDESTRSSAFEAAAGRNALHLELGDLGAFGTHVGFFNDDIVDLAVEIISIIKTTSEAVPGFRDMKPAVDHAEPVPPEVKAALTEAGIVDKKEVA